MIEFKKIKLNLLDANTGQIPGLPANPRQWADSEVRRLAKSMKDTPELAEARGCVVVPFEGRYVILGGNLRREAAASLKWADIMCAVLPEGTKPAKLKEVVLKDNSSFGEWDLAALRNDWADAPLPEWGVDVVWDTAGPDPTKDETEQETEQETIERMKHEFEERMAAGEISEEDEEYQEFLEKFKLKKTTDDCYTPAPVYEAVARYVEETYGVSRANFVRPFYPGGDYQNEKYPKGCVVVDNPPFSLLSEILEFYQSRGIRFFLFAPTLTLFGSVFATKCTALPCALAVIYENGASVNTSFLTNLEPECIRVKSAPKLYAMAQEGVEAYLKEIRKAFPKYQYPENVITAPWVGLMSRAGVEFSVPVSESEPISGLDQQKAVGKAIYGKGYLVSDAVAADRRRAEDEKKTKEEEERQKTGIPVIWELSERERGIIKRLNEPKRTF